jgi:glycosyl-4,4'-diaponeurosporenoate acyltransferase
VLIELPILWIIVLNVGGWLAIQMGFAWAFTQLPVTWFNPGDAFVWERRGQFYESVFGIKAWKDRLPDAARWFGSVIQAALAGERRALGEGRKAEAEGQKSKAECESCFHGAFAFRV